MKMYFRRLKNNVHINHISKSKSINVLRASSDLFCRKVCFAVMFFLCEDNCENSVGPAAGFIHVGGSHSSGWTKLGNYITWTHTFFSAAAIIKYDCYTKGLGHLYNCCYWAFALEVFNNLSPANTWCAKRDGLRGYTGCSCHVLEISLLSQRRKTEPALLLPRRALVTHTRINHTHLF